jgi:hypothetical protein
MKGALIVTTVYEVLEKINDIDEVSTNIAKYGERYADEAIALLEEYKDMLLRLKIK